MKLLFTAALQGSTKAFRLFFEALRVYDVDVGVMLGDLSGSAFVPLLKVSQNTWQTSLGDRTLTLETQAELTDAVRQLEDRGHYWIDVSAEEFEATKNDEGLIDLLFKSAVRRRMEDWLEMAPGLMNGSGTRVFMCPGGNDWRVIDDLLESAAKIEPCDGRIVHLDGYDMITCGAAVSGSSEAVRTLTENEIGRQLDGLFAQARDRRRTILNCRARSRAADKAVKRFEPLLRIFGAGAGTNGAVSHVGHTLSLDPGLAISDDGNSGLNGAVVLLENGRVDDYTYISV